MKSRTASAVRTATETPAPRFREAGDITLDRCNRDGRVDARWLSLAPPEFDLLWRLAEQPGVPVSEERLLAEMWGVPPARAVGTLAAQVSGLRAKLEPFGLEKLVLDHPGGGYVLAARPGPGAFAF